MLVATLACDRGERKAESDEDPPAGAEKSDPDEPGAPATARSGATELFEYGFYRAPAERAVFLLPKHDDGWTVVYDPREKTTMVGLLLGTPKAYRGWVKLLVMHADLEGKPDQFATHFTELITKQSPHLTTSAPEPFEVGNGDAVRIRLKGTSPAGQAEEGELVSMRMGKNFAVMTVLGEAGSRPLQAMAKGFLANLRLNEQVPHLVPHDPGTPLEGTYAHDSELFRTFDPRGYVAQGRPEGRLATDIDARYQCAVLAEATKQNISQCALDRYAIAGGELKIGSLNAVGDGAGEPIEVRRDGVKIGTRVFARVDGQLGADAQLDGTYNWSFSETFFVGDSSASSYERRNYTLRANGTWALDYESSFSAMFYSAAPGADGLPNHLGDVYVDGVPPAREGRWTRDGDMLVLTDESGKTTALTLFADPKAKGTQPLASVYIDGRRHTRG